MQEILANNYLLLKALHLIAVMSWMAGMLYLPRLYVYHCQVKVGSEASEMFKTMERKLLRAIINPAMIVTWVLGLTLAYIGDVWMEPWFHGKMTLLIIMSGMHGILSKHRKRFAADNNQKSEKFFRILNEVPAVLMVGIVLLAVIKYF